MAFSAMHSARRSGRWKFISEGASVSGVSWKRKSTPSSRSSCPVRVISSVGGSRLGSPCDAVKPSPTPIRPCGPGGRSPPVW